MADELAANDDVVSGDVCMRRSESVLRHRSPVVVVGSGWDYAAGGSGTRNIAGVAIGVGPGVAAVVEKDDQLMGHP